MVARAEPTREARQREGRAARGGRPAGRQPREAQPTGRPAPGADDAARAGTPVPSCGAGAAADATADGLAVVRLAVTLGRGEDDRVDGVDGVARAAGALPPPYIFTVLRCTRPGTW